MAYVLSLLVFGGIANSVWAASLENPYQGIVQRNVFDVKPPSDPMPEAPPAPPIPEIWLNGITDILGKKQVLMKVRFPPKPPAPPKEETYILTEGQREGDIEILAIDVKVSTVKVKILDAIMNLSLDANGAKLANVPSDANMVKPAPLAYDLPPRLPLPARRISLPSPR